MGYTPITKRFLQGPDGEIIVEIKVDSKNTLRRSPNEKELAILKKRGAVGIQKEVEIPVDVAGEVATVRRPKKSRRSKRTAVVNTEE